MHALIKTAAESVSLGGTLTRLSKPELRRIRFLVNCSDGFKFVACMETETSWEDERILSAWVLFGSLKPLDRIMRSTSKGYMETIRPRLPVVSGTFAQCKDFRPGASIQVRCHPNDAYWEAARRANDFISDYFYGKRRRGYVSPGNSSLPLQHHLLLQTLDWFSSLADLGGEDWMTCGAWASSIAASVQPTQPATSDAMAMLGAPRRRLLSLQPPQPPKP